MSQEVTLFKNANGNCKVALRSGEVVAFLQAHAEGGPSQFFTTNKRLQAELQAAADEGEFGIFVDPNEDKIDPEAATPMQQLEKKLRAQIMAELAAKPIDAGTSLTSPQQAQSSIVSTAGGVADNTALSVAQLAAQQNQQTVEELKADEEKKDDIIQPAGSGSIALTALLAAKNNKPS